MFHQLTKYLFHYKQVSIPSVGTLYLVQQPARLNVVDKLIEPPGYLAELKTEQAVTDHQLDFLSRALKAEKETVRRNLQELGDRLQRKIQNDGFEWKGIGWLRQAGHQFAVLPEAMEPIPAAKVLRQNAEHSVLVGDQQLTSTQIAGQREGFIVRGRTSVWMIIGWVLLFLSILYIVFVLYLGKFRFGATGSRQSPVGLVHFPGNDLWLNARP